MQNDLCFMPEIVLKSGYFARGREAMPLMLGNVAAFSVLIPSIFYTSACCSKANCRVDGPRDSSRSRVLA